MSQFQFRGSYWALNVTNVHIIVLVAILVPVTILVAAQDHVVDLGTALRDWVVFGKGAAFQLLIAHRKKAGTNDEQLWGKLWLFPLYNFKIPPHLILSFF